MTPSLSQRPFAAAAGAALIAVSLVAIPAEHVAPAAARVEVHAVQLQGVVAAEVSALLNTAGAAEAVSATTDSATGTGTVAATETETPTIGGALMEVVTSFVVMTLVAPISIALSPLLLVTYALTDSGRCTTIACMFAPALIGVAVVGPAIFFVQSLERLWSAIFPPVPSAAAVSGVSTPSSLIQARTDVSSQVSSARLQKPAAQRNSTGAVVDPAESTTPERAFPTPADTVVLPADIEVTAIPAAESESPATPTGPSPLGEVPARDASGGGDAENPAVVRSAARAGTAQPAADSRAGFKAAAGRARR